MLGLVVLFFLLLWLLLTILATRLGWRFGKRNSKKAWVKWLCAAVGFFATMGWYIASEIYHYTKEQIWVTRFCTENPRIKVYITPEQFTEILKTGDYSKYKDNQPSFNYIDKKYAEFNGERYVNLTYNSIDEKYNNYKVVRYDIGRGASKNTISIRNYFVYHPYSIILFFYSEFYSVPRDPLRLEEWYYSIRGCELTREERRTIYEHLDLYRKIAGDTDE